MGRGTGGETVAREMVACCMIEETMLFAFGKTDCTIGLVYIGAMAKPNLEPDQTEPEPEPKRRNQPIRLVHQS